ncbi:MAG: gliding motility-associated C-terminal domain-containing protein [Flavobacteriales bacterium]
MVRILAGLFMFFFILLSNAGISQCIVINEVLIDGAGGCDGSCSPNTEEWVELYNTCSTPVNIGCYVLGDGDWSVRIPTNTIIPAYGFYTIGSNNSGIPINLNIGTCVCAEGGSQIGVFTNGSEQLVLLNSSGVVENAVIWGGGQLPANISNTDAGCGNINQTFTAANIGIFDVIPLDANDGGCSYARTCDGASDWEMRCGSEISGQSTNGQPVLVDFDATSSSICTGECIDFTDLSEGDPQNWDWQFEGATTSTSTNETPSNICYSSAGTFDVTLTITTACGVFTYTAPDFITVTNPATPIISADVNNICEGEIASLSTTSTGSLQWYLNNAPINGATSSSYAATESGDYTLVAGSGNCTSESNSITINVTAFDAPVISPNGTISICAGETVDLTINQAYANMQWFDASGSLLNENGQDLQVSASGNYYCEVSENGCSAISNSVQIEVYDMPQGTINPLGPLIICPGSSVHLELTGDYTTLDWTLDGANISTNTSSIEASEAGEYQATLHNEIGCSFQTNVVIVDFSEVQNVDISFLDGYEVICPDATATIIASDGFAAYNWILNGNSVSNAQSLVVDTQGTFDVEATDSNGCIAEASITITQSALPNSVINPNSDIETCLENYELSVIAGNSYQWYFNGNSILGETNNAFSAAESGVYYVVATNQYGCSAVSNEIEINFIEPVAFTIETPEITCEGNTVTLEVLGNPIDVLWNTGATTNTINISMSGVYSALATFSNNCTSESSTEYIFSSTPFLDYNVVQQAKCFEGAILTLETNGTLDWNLPEVSVNADSTQMVVDIIKDKTLRVTSTINDCSTTELIELIVDCSSLYIPNAFTPNQDGTNDYFQVVGEGIAEFEIIVYNRWGAEVYRSNNLDNKWDGGFDAYYVPDGVYYYIVKALDMHGQPVLNDIDQLGTITILR